MPVKVAALVRDISRLIRNPHLLDTYEQSSQYWERQASENQRRTENYASAIKGYQSTLKSYEEAIALSKEIAPQIYFDRESGLLQSFQYIDLKENSQPVFRMSHGEFTAEGLGRRLEAGLLEPMTQQQVEEKGQWPSSIEKLKQMAAQCGLEIHADIDCRIPPMITIQEVALPVNDWKEAEDLISAVARNEVCGILTFGRGEFAVYTDPEKYVREYKGELGTVGVMGVKEVTLSKDPALHKEMDDIKWGAFGEKNPYDLKHYQDKYAEKQATELEATPELEGEAPEL